MVGCCLSHKNIVNIRSTQFGYPNRAVQTDQLLSFLYVFDIVGQQTSMEILRNHFLDDCKLQQYKRCYNCFPEESIYGWMYLQNNLNEMIGT